MTPLADLDDKGFCPHCKADMWVSVPQHERDCPTWALEARVGELEAACGGWSSALAEAMEDLTEQQARADALAAERDALREQVAELVKAIEHPSESSVSRRCSWCEQPYTTVVTLQPTPADNERIKADARQHFLTCSAHPVVAAKEQAERTAAALQMLAWDLVQAMDTEMYESSEGAALVARVKALAPTKEEA